MNPSKEQKIKILPHIRYEMEMIFYLPAVRGNPQIQNAIVETLLIHVRNLKSFFDASNSRYFDDVIPSDFGFKAKKKLGISQKIIDRLHKDLAHISYSRLTRTPPKKKWIYTDFIPQVKTRCIEFIQYILKEYDSKLSKEELRDWRNLLSCLQKP